MAEDNVTIQPVEQIPTRLQSAWFATLNEKR